MQPMLNIALRAARLAGEQIARASERLDLIKSERDNLNDFLKETAEKSERAAAYSIQKAYPSHTITGDFSGTLPGNSESPDVVWHISPVDNFRNFSRGMPACAMTLVARQKGRVEHVVILNPISGEEFTASRGRGAHLNGKRIRVSSQRTTEQALLCSSFMNSSQEKDLYSTYTKLLNNVQFADGAVYNTGSPALDLAYTAAGRVDGCIQLTAEQEVLDGGTLLIQEAGGLMGDMQGGNQFREKGQCVAANPKLFKALVQITHNLQG